MFKIKPIMVQNYLEKFPNALLNYQYIEEALKQYIYRTDIMAVTEKYGSIDTKINKKFNNAIKKIPLEILVKMFGRRNINIELVKKLNDLPLKAKIISFQKYLSGDRNDNDEKLKKQLLSFDNVLLHSENCVHELFVELGNLEKRFDDFKEKY
ncbi:MAG: hypothetical protein ACC657_02145 [Thiohalomonadales bacterium]